MLLNPIIKYILRAQIYNGVYPRVIKHGFMVTAPRGVSSQDEGNSIENTRNIGIIAHIDAVCFLRSATPNPINFRKG